MFEFKGILTPTMRFANEEGKITFEMKRKDKYGRLYYLFRVYKENFSEEALKGWPAVWTMIRSLSADLGIPLYDVEEVMEAVNARTKMFVETPEGRKARKKANKTGKSVLIKDVEIKVFDHATKNIDTLTIGISAGPISDRGIDIPRVM